MRPLRVLLAVLFLASGLPAFAGGAGDVTAERLAGSDGDGANWFTLGRDARQSYFSPLHAMDAASVGRLGFAWAYDLGTVRGQEATPIVVDGVM
jgi:glucose dehydrogenase